MIPQNLPFTPASQRLTLVYGVTPVAGQGPSLQEIDSEGLPDGALVYCELRNAFYRLKKTSALAQDTTNYANIVAASGGGNWVRVVQAVQGLLVAGTVTFTGLDVPDVNTPRFSVSLVTPHGTPGYLYAFQASPTSVTVLSTSNTDTSLVLLEAS